MDDWTTPAPGGAGDGIVAGQRSRLSRSGVVDVPTFGSLFAGIGGIDLGLERAGWTGRFQVEYEPFCQRVLAKHWPDVHRVGDVHDAHGADYCPTRLADTVGDERSVGGKRSAVEGCRNCLPRVDLLAGGFPCQPVSFAGRRQIQDDDRWLWPEFARCIRELRPRYVLVENVPGLLLGGGMDDVLGGLAELGYDTEWESIPAAAVGAPHLRYRVWIVAYANDSGWARRTGQQRPAGRGEPADGGGDVAYANGLGQGRTPTLGPPSFTGSRPQGAGAEPHGAGARAVPDADGFRRSDGTDGHDPARLARSAHQSREGGAQWLTEPDVGRVAHGVPARVDRLRALGNAVVPQVVEFIGRRILEAEAEAVA
jgi:DNA (cytosine-5)-methyltransferase 1